MSAETTDAALLFSPKPPTAEMRALRHAGREIAYCVIVSTDKRRTRSVIKVKPGGRVELHLPKSQRRTDPAALMARHANWVVRKLDEQRRQLAPQPVQWEAGKEHWFLGERLRLACMVSPRRHVEAGQGQLRVCGPLHDTASIRRQMEGFLREQALAVFGRRMEAIAAPLPWVAEVPPMKVRLMKSRWGSCSSRGSIVMNTALVKAPLPLIDYVLLHELCHLKEHNHSPRFYRLMDAYMPEWKARKVELSALAPALLPQ